ncbi:hypothetical protein KJ068_15195 [bacterium]|nr:hypothetical protein [bacterium]
MQKWQKALLIIFLLPLSLTTLFVCLYYAGSEPFVNGYDQTDRLVLVYGTNIAITLLLFFNALIGQKILRKKLEFCWVLSIAFSCLLIYFLIAQNLLE